MTIPETLRAEELARLFHETYERLAPVFGYKTRRESAVPWESVPESNRNLMEAVAAEILSVVGARSVQLEATVDYWIGEAKGFETDADEAQAENKRLRSELDDVRAIRDRLWAERVAAVAMLRIECAEYDDNDWPDTLHLADVVEKHLADPAAEAVKEAEACAKRLREALEFYAIEGRYSYDEDGVPEPENPQFSSYEDAGIRRDRGQVARRALASLAQPESMTDDA